MCILQDFGFEISGLPTVNSPITHQTKLTNFGMFIIYSNQLTLNDF